MNIKELAPYESEHITRVRQFAPECMVLLTSNGCFPLKAPGKLALYGSGARRTLKGGRGSADVNVRCFPTAEQGLENAGFEITTKHWLNAYDETRANARVLFRAWLKEKIAAEGMDTLMENLSIVMPEPEYELPLDGGGDTAVYVLSRLCGEGTDRLDQPGDISLSKTEIRDILMLQKQYLNFILVLNTACMVDLAPIAEQVDNVLLLSQPGITVGDSLADVLLGKTYPSGKLAATWYAREDRPTVGEFGDRNDTRYREGIYVGYRYFDSIGKTPLFPFGFGLGYTTFSLRAGATALEGTNIRVPVTVRNTGKLPGKEVVQVYVSLPQGALDQPYQMLAAFAKTKELAPGEEECVTLTIPLEGLASFDVDKCLRVLETGEYILRVGNSSRHIRPLCAVRLDEDIHVERVAHVGGSPDFIDWSPSDAERERSRILSDALSAQAEDIELETDYAVLTVDCASFTQRRQETPAVNPEALALTRTLSNEDLLFLCMGEFQDEGSKSVIGDAAITVAGAAGETTARFRSQGVENLIMADGPSGLRLSRSYGVDEQGVYPIEETHSQTEKEETLALMPDTIRQTLMAMLPSLSPKERQGEPRHQYCTAIPVAAAIAQSWSTELAQACGGLVAAEMKQFGIDIWLAPAMNIQRNPLCGRNFEYYSEDPYISGKMAAAITEGVQKETGLAVTIKHFICNNQEANRFRTSSAVSERALRDIYARGFELVVKEAAPRAFMSSYNLLNGVHTSERGDLIETMLRSEWGFTGIVMSDFLTGDESASDKSNKYPKFASAASIEAGVDLLMPGGKAHYENVLKALKSGTLARDRAEACAARMISFAWSLKKEGGSK